MPRRTHCFTYGETRTSTITMNGARLAAEQTTDDPSEEAPQ